MNRELKLLENAPRDYLYYQDRENFADATVSSEEGQFLHFNILSSWFLLNAIRMIQPPTRNTSNSKCTQRNLQNFLLGCQPCYSGKVRNLYWITSSTKMWPCSPQIPTRSSNKWNFWLIKMQHSSWFEHTLPSGSPWLWSWPTPLNFLTIYCNPKEPVRSIHIPSPPGRPSCLQLTLYIYAISLSHMPQVIFHFPFLEVSHFHRMELYAQKNRNVKMNRIDPRFHWHRIIRPYST